MASSFLENLKKSVDTGEFNSEAAKKIIEVPIIFELRENGHSKLPKTTIFKNFILVISIKFKHLLA